MNASPTVRLRASIVSSFALAALAVMLCAPAASSQMRTVSLATTLSSAERPSPSSSSLSLADDAADVPARFLADSSSTVQSNSTGHVLLHAIGTELHIGVNGAGLDVAMPIARRWNVRVGGQYLQYTAHFTEQGANIDAALRVGNGKAGLDWFPFNNGFRISPQAYFAIQTDMKGTVIVPAGQTISLNGADYISSATDPLTGTARVTTRKAAPGLTIGWGNISPRGKGHLSFPVEIGFYYIGQPTLAVTFKGSVCDPAQPAITGCQSVTTDADFQKNLARFIARNNNNLKYASFFPVAQFGVGYRF